VVNVNDLVTSALGWPWYVQLLAALLVLGLVILLLRSLSEGRDVSLGPLKIGARSQKPTNVERDATPIGKPQADRVPPAVEAKAMNSRSLTVPKVHLDARPIGLLRVEGGDLFVLTEAHRNVAVGASQECDVPIKDELMSRVHFRVLVDPESAEEGKLRVYRITVVDAGSRNGTFLNGRIVRRRSDLSDGDTIQAGGVRITYSRIRVSGAE